MVEKTESLFQRILLIEDDSSHVLLIKRALRSFAAEVKHVPSMEEALSVVREFRPDVVISDLHLGSSEALAAFPTLRELSNDAPIIVLTSSAALNDAVEAMKQGARDFIVKNFEKDFVEILGFSLSRIQVALALEHEQRRLTRQIQTLQVAIENSHDGLALISGAGKVSYSNSAFRLFAERCGGTVDSLESLFSAAVKGHENVTQELKEKIRTLPAGALSNIEIMFAQERDVAFDLSLTVIGHAHGDIGEGAPAEKQREVVMWVRDISDLKRKQRFQREVLSTTTHDLKGPLSAIMSASELIPQCIEDSERVTNFALRIGSSARNALNLIDEFLSARRIQEGSMILRPRSHDLVEVVRESLEDYQTMCKARSIALVFNGTHAPVMAQVDKLGIGRVISNLVSNAIKFTSKGGTVTVMVEAAGDDVHIQVQDTGSGMEPAEVQKLFGRFTRLDRHREIAGTGLGLFVVKSIVNAHGGSIGVTSAVGQGTRFDVLLPVQPQVNERGELICVDFE